jgi:hypothetical protein
MSKKYTFLMLNLLVLNTVSIFSMSEDDKRAIRKELYSNYKNDRINAIILAETGLTLSEVIDRDIQILSEHEKVLLKKMDIYKNRMIWDPAFDKVGVVFSGAIFSSAAFIHAIAAEKIKEFTNDGKLLVRTGNWFTDYVEYFQMSTCEYKNLVAKNLSIKAAQDPEATIACLCVLPAYIITGTAAVICLKKIYDVLRNPYKLRACFQKVKNRFERDQAIIAQLKEIKHTLAI